MDVNPKIVVPPNNPFVHRVFHYFHHPFWGIPIFGNIHILGVAPSQDASDHYKTSSVGDFDKPSFATVFLGHSQGDQVADLGCEIFQKHGGKSTKESTRPDHRYSSRWWFQTFFIFTSTWGDDPISLIFFKWVGSTTT